MTTTTEILSRADRQAFADLKKRDFAFRHRLGTSPLLSMDSLRILARYMQDKHLSYFFQNSSDQMSGWGDQPKGLTLNESFDQLKSGNVLIILKSAHAHPDYEALLDSFLIDLGLVLGVDVRKNYRRPICTIIMASPHRVTPYHVDDSHNLLLQVQGDKDFYVLDASDPDILTAAERSAFWDGDVNAARHTPAKQAKAKLYRLTPDLGVHVPFLYPHWAENGDEVSIAVSMNFQSKDDLTLNAHGFNNLLRSRGFHPSAPGRNTVVDTSKAMAFRALASLKDLLPSRA